MTTTTTGNCTRDLALWRPGERMPDVDHQYRYTGTVPCTGRQVCFLCGTVKPEPEPTP